MDPVFSYNLLAGLHQTKIFSFHLVDGHCIIPFAIHFVSPDNKQTYVGAVAFPGTTREYSVLIDKADIIENQSTGKIEGTVWIDLDLGVPTPLSRSLGAAIEARCRERRASDK